MHSFEEHIDEKQVGSLEKNQVPPEYLLLAKFPPVPKIPPNPFQRLFMFYRIREVVLT